MGMSDAQYKDVLRGLVNDLERIKAAGVGKEAEVEIDKMIERFKAFIEA